MSPGAASTSKWNAADYARVGGFVAELGAAALDLLDPQPGEGILDVGCGEGTLTRKIVERGATVLGIDNSPEMIEAARANGIDAILMDAEDLPFSSEFDAAFSNATLHGVLGKEQAARAIYRSLKAGGRFAGEMGGAGNIRILRGGLRDELEARGYVLPAEDPAWYPTIEEFVRLYGCAGFVEVQAQLIARPTPLPSGVAGWVTTFRAGLLDMAMVPEWERADVAAAVERRLEGQLRQPDGGWIADYVRLRFTMRKPA